MKKSTRMASYEFAYMLKGVSKAAIIDALWCACHLGTNETTREIEIRAARETEIALRERGDRIPRTISATAGLALEGD